MNGENDLDEFRGPVGPEACRRTALGYAYNRLSVNTRSDTTVLLGRASSEPHSYVLTWLSVTIYIYNI